MLTEFYDEAKKYPNNLFCFFEGEDEKYYLPRIKSFYSIGDERIRHHSCNGKNNVLDVIKILNKKPEYTNIKKMFFIDKDFESLSDLEENVFETPCYSIENLYVNENCFGRLMVGHCGLNHSTIDFNKSMHDFNQTFSLFNDSVLIFNSWLKCQIKRGSKSRLNLKNVKVTSWFNNISINKVEPIAILQKSFFESQYPESTPIDEKEIDEEKEFFKTISKPEYSFRGKNQLEFFIKYLSVLNVEINSKKYLLGKHFKSKLECFSSNPLEFLSQYADTPDELTNFFRKLHYSF